MRNRHQRSATPWLAAAAIGSALLPIADGALAQQSEIEEIVVTGSYIRRTEGFRAASPITQISSDDIVAAGTPNMGDVINNLSFNQGSTVTQNSLTGASSTATSINLRGLGEGATLNLVDGMRVIGTNVNSFLPQIAIGRMDIVTDGAAALYGSAAVAGVVNFVPIKSYDGIKIQGYTQGDDEGDYEDYQVSMLTGTQWNGLDIVGAVEYRRNGRLRMIDRPEQMNAGLTSSSTPNPGRYLVPTRDENGNLTGETTTMSDPNCGGTRQDPSQEGNNPTGFTFGGQCWYDFGEFWDYRAKQSQVNAFANVGYQVSSDFSWNAQWNYYNRRPENRGSPSNPGGRTSELPTIRGELPGNPFRAVDANGNPLFALDANGDGIPDRDSSGQVVLDPDGIPFNEDVSFGAWRPWGKHGTLPSQLGSDGASHGKGDITGWRVALSSDFAVPYVAGWEGHTSYTYSRRTDESRLNNFSFSAFENGLNCDVLGAPETCFNPFVSTDPSTLNSQALVDSTYVQNRQHEETELQTFDLVLNGRIPTGKFELPGGDIGAAFGYQRRESSFDNTPSLHSLLGDQFIGAQLSPVSDGRSVDAFFAELALPVLSNLEVSLAVRNEDYSSGQSSTDPKYGIVYSPLDTLTLRASAGTSFIAPSLDDLNAPESCGLTNVSDPFTVFAAFTASCSRGNPDLVPESADTLSAGFTWTIMPSMTLDVDWSETDFTDRIITTTTEDVLSADFFNFQQAYGAVPAGSLPTLAQVADWVADPRSDPRIVRNPSNLEQIDRIISGRLNASSMFVRSYDLKWNYFFDLGGAFGLTDLIGVNDMGAMNVALNASYIDEYTYQLSPDREVVDGVGQQNNGTGAVPPLPKWKGNLSLGWAGGQHSFNFTVHYIDEIVFDANKFSFQRFLPYSNYRNVDVLRASTIADAAYNFSQFERLGGEFTFTLGARNLFDREPQKVPMLGGIESMLYDPTGRMIYARITYEL